MSVSTNRMPDQGFLVAIPATVDPPSGIDGAKWATFLSYLALLTALTPERRNQGHWINIPHGVLRSQLGGKYRGTIGQLLDAEIIELNETYSTGWNGRQAFSKSYRLTPQHRHGRSKLFDINYVGARRRARKTHEIDKSNLRSAGMHFLRSFDRFSIDVDSAAADKRLHNHWHQWSVARFANRQEFACRCEYRRYHCLMTQLPRIARKYLSASGHHLSIADVSACQPVLLGLLATLHPQPNTLHPHTTTLLPYGARFSWRRAAAKDVLDWLDLCESGAIYAFIRDEVVKESAPALVTLTTKRGHRIEVDLRESSPKAFKRTSLIPVFNRLSPMLASPVFKVIQSHFPTIASWLVNAKCDQHQQVACLLQRSESELMIDGVGNELRKRFPDEPVQPIHDALIVRDGFEDSAAAVIAKQFENVGLRPRIKRERIHDDI